MVSYTESDMQELLMSYEIKRGYWEDCVPQAEDFFDKGTPYDEICKAMKKETLIIFIRVRDGQIECNLKDFLRLFNYEVALNYLNTSPLQHQDRFFISTLRGIFDFLHMDLRYVPMYVRVYPELSSWRLRVGK